MSESIIVNREDCKWTVHDSIHRLEKEAENLIHEQLKEDISEVKKKVEELGPQKMTFAVKLTAFSIILLLVSTLVGIGISYGGTASKVDLEAVKSKVTAVEIDVASTRIQVQEINKKLAESSEDRKEIKDSLNTLLSKIMDLYKR